MSEASVQLPVGAPAAATTGEGVAGQTDEGGGGLRWLDPLAALFIAAVAVREGLETWRGEGCCAGPELRPDAGCKDEWCS